MWVVLSNFMGFHVAFVLVCEGNCAAETRQGYEAGPIRRGMFSNDDNINKRIIARD